MIPNSYYALARHLARAWFPNLRRIVPQDWEQTIQLAALMAERRGGGVKTHLSREMRDLAVSVGWHSTGRGTVTTGSDQHIAARAAICQARKNKRTAEEMRRAQAKRSPESLRRSGERGGAAYRDAVRERVIPKWQTAYKLREKGMSLSSIAKALGYASEAGVSMALKALRTHISGSVAPLATTTPE